MLPANDYYPFPTPATTRALIERLKIAGASKGPRQAITDNPNRTIVLPFRSPSRSARCDVYRRARSPFINLIARVTPLVPSLDRAEFLRRYVSIRVLLLSLSLSLSRIFSDVLTTPIRNVTSSARNSDE